MKQVSFDNIAVLELRDQVGGGDVNKITGGKRQKPQYIDLPGQNKRQNPAHYHGQAGNKIEYERPTPGPAAMHQDAEIPQFLGYLVRRYRQSCRQAEPRADQKGRTHGQAVDKIVQAIGKEDHIGHRVLMLARHAMAMMPMDKLFEY